MKRKKELKKMKWDNSIRLHTCAIGVPKVEQGQINI